MEFYNFYLNNTWVVTPPFVVEEFITVEIILNYHLTSSEMDRQRPTSIDGDRIRHINIRDIHH
jgi:hypothetical protein